MTCGATVSRNDLSIGMNERCRSREFRSAVVNRSEMIAFTAADLTIAGRYSSGRSGGQRTIRRATPSSSISAAAAVSWSVVAIRTDPSRSSALRPLSADPASKSRQVKRASALEINGADPWSAVLTASQRDAALFCNILIEAHEIAKGDGKLGVF